MVDASGSQRAPVLEKAVTLYAASFHFPLLGAFSLMAVLSTFSVALVTVLNLGLMSTAKYNTG